MARNILNGTTDFFSDYKRFEAGTFEPGLICGWAVACAYIDEIGKKSVHTFSEAFYERIVRMLDCIDGLVKVPNTHSNARSIISFYCSNAHPHDIEENLGKRGAVVRSGHMCNQGSINNMGVAALTRVSWGIYNTFSDIDALGSNLREILRNKL